MLAESRMTAKQSMMFANRTTSVFLSIPMKCSTCLNNGIQIPCDCECYITKRDCLCAKLSPAASQNLQELYQSKQKLKQYGIQSIYSSSMLSSRQKFDSMDMSDVSGNDRGNLINLLNSGHMTS